MFDLFFVLFLVGFLCLDLMSIDEIDVYFDCDCIWVIIVVICEVVIK